MLDFIISIVKGIIATLIAGVITLSSIFIPKANPQPSSQIIQQSVASSTVNERIAELEKEIAEMRSPRTHSNSSATESKSASTPIGTLQKQINALKSATANAPKITLVNPSIIISGFENTISISGTGFQSGARIKLGDTYLQIVGDTVPTLISTKYPSGFNPGLYDITVVNPDNTQFTLPGAITIKPGSPAPVNETLSTSQIVQKVSPAVVLVRTNLGCGSGMILTSDGYILTNNHVISGASGINIYFSNGSASNATVIGNNVSEDLALLKIPLNGLTVVALGSSAEASLPLGADVVALGYPLTCNQDQTLEIETGNITARRSSDLGELLQTSARVNQGNSGGPLIDNHGNVIGINTLAVGVFFGLNLSGIAFAIPSDTFKQYLGTLGLPNTQSASQGGNSVSSTPQVEPLTISNISPISSNPRQFIINGSGFCVYAGSADLFISGYPLINDVSVSKSYIQSWTDNQIIFTLPSSVPAGTYYIKVRIGGYVGTLGNCSESVIDVRSQSTITVQ